jgi:hypothetical protein
LHLPCLHVWIFIVVFVLFIVVIVAVEVVVFILGIVIVIDAIANHERKTNVAFCHDTGSGTGFFATGGGYVVQK